MKLNIPIRQFCICLLLFSLMSLECAHLQSAAASNFFGPDLLIAAQDNGFCQDARSAIQLDLYTWFDYFEACDAFTISRITQADEGQAKRSRISLAVFYRLLLSSTIGLFFYLHLPHIMNLETGTRRMMACLHKKDGKK